MEEIGLLHTEQRNQASTGIDRMSTGDMLRVMAEENAKVPSAVEEALPAIERAVELLTERMRRGGRMVYVGAGTSGRLGVTDASEIPPTYGVHDKFIGLIAGGDSAFRNAVEGAEDNSRQGWEDILAFHPTPDDTVVGISASGGAPYVVGALREARAAGLLTGIIACSKGSRAGAVAEVAIEAVVGPEFVTGSTRMKSGTATKLILNMISTAVMIRLGHVRGNRMVDMQLTNAKLVDRGTRMIMSETDITDYDLARELLLKYGSVRAAVERAPQDC